MQYIYTMISWIAKRLSTSFGCLGKFCDDHPLTSSYCIDFFFLFSFSVSQRAKVTDEIPEAAEDYSKEFSKLNSKTESDKVHGMGILMTHNV